MTETTQKPLTVTQVTTRIKTVLEGQFSKVEVTGELSDVRSYTTGKHFYFTLKDTGACLPCAMFAGFTKAINFTPTNGLKVIATGEINVYAPQGRYQLIVRKLTLQGQGDLMAQFEALKQKLKAEGLFDRKRPLPHLPRHIGIVTAPTGAAIRDMINVLSRRFPNIDILIAPAKVQGAGAAEEIARGILALNQVGTPNFLPQYKKRELIIIGRGGGSIEDLWCFNEEIVSRTIYASKIPIISAVGHEIDFTISDFTADLRAPTPSAAAELAIPEKDKLQERIRTLQNHLQTTIFTAISKTKIRIQAAETNRVFAQPAHTIYAYIQRLEILANRAQNALDNKLDDITKRLTYATNTLILKRTQKIPELLTRTQNAQAALLRATQITLQNSRNRLQLAQKALTALSPIAVLERGYSITLLDNGRALRTPEEAPPGTHLTTRLSKGKTISSIVGNKTKPSKSHKQQDDKQLSFDL